MWTSVCIYLLHFSSFPKLHISCWPVPAVLGPITTGGIMTAVISGKFLSDARNRGNYQVKHVHSLICSWQLCPGNLLSRMKGKKSLLKIFGFKVCDAPLRTTQSEQHFWLAQMNISVKCNRGYSNLQLSAHFLATIRQDCELSHMFFFLLAVQPLAEAKA